MHTSRFATPEAAALSGFPPQCRVVASLAGGDDAYVLLDTGQPGAPYLYGACVSRDDDGWQEGTSGNGSGWTLTDSERDLGTATVWDAAPEGADRVRASLDGEVREADVVEGMYLVAWWRVPAAALDRLRVEAFRIGGAWVPATG